MISVLIPTEGRQELVRALLNSLVEARKRQECEVIVVDSSSGSEAAQLVADCAATGGRYLHGPRSVRAKRNLAAREAGGDLLVFVDSDCEVAPDFLVAWDAWFLRPGRADAAAGPTVFPPPDSPHTRRLATSSLLAPFSNPGRLGPIRWATASNFAITREAFFAVGGFREDLPFLLGGDDLELCLTLAEHSRALEAWPPAVVHHGWETWRSPWSVMRRAFRWGRALVHVLARHPSYAMPAPPDLSHFVWGSALLGSVAAAQSRSLVPLSLPLVFTTLAVLVHALPPSVLRGWRAGRDDLAVGLLELPFAFGHLLECAKAGRPSLWMRRVTYDPEPGFPAMVNDLWANVIALSIAVPLVLA